MRSRRCLVSDVVSGLLAKLDELETAAKRALAGYPAPEYNMESAYLTRVWQADYHKVIAVMTREPTPEQLAARTVNPRRELVADCGPANVYPAEHMALNDPHSVLRLCRAHRDLIKHFEAARTKAVTLAAERAHPTLVMEAHGATTALHHALRILARGLSVEETEDSVTPGNVKST
jgi:hypothetical protein